MKREITRIYGAISFVLFVTILAKAYLAGFLHDESISYTLAKGDKAWSLTANNHWGNSILSFFCGKLFGYAPLSLRLPNVLMFLVYAVFVYKIGALKPFQCNGIVFVLFAAFLLFNQLIIDYFSMCRGYGLALAFSLVSVYYFFKSLSHFKFRNYCLAVLCGLIAIYCNYSFLTFIFGLNLAYLIMGFWIGEIRDRATKISLMAMGQLFLLIPAVLNLQILANTDQLYYGGESNVITDTLSSVVAFTFGVEGTAQFILLGLFLLTLAAPVFFSRRNYYARFLTILIVTLLLVPSILHWSFGVLMPMQRTALYWMVVWALCFLVAGSIISKQFASKFVKIATLLVACFLVLFSSVFFFSNLRPDHFINEKRDADVREMLTRLESEIDPTKTYQLGIDWDFEPAVNYYRETLSLDWLERVNRKGPKSTMDFFYVRLESDLPLPDAALREIENFPLSSSILLKRNQ